MKKLIAALALAAITTPSRSAIVGKLGMDLNLLPITVRDLHDGLWEVGGKSPFWTLSDDKSNDVWLQASVFGAWRLEGQDPAFGLCAGVPFSAVGAGIANGLQSVALQLPSAPPWAKKAGDALSLDAYVGARPVFHAPDDHRVMYGVGAQVNIKFGDLFQWASGTQSQGTGVKGL